ncbi:hypothetical protein, partial [Brucella sp. SA075A]|uniref:hypothetical protein n=1 Tax=Brucella sp. SA075A TaxID=3121521 RepID=UPI003B986F5A
MMKDVEKKIDTRGTAIGDGGLHLQPPPEPLYLYATHAFGVTLDNDANLIYWDAPMPDGYTIMFDPGSSILWPGHPGSIYITVYGPNKDVTLTVYAWSNQEMSGTNFVGSAQITFKASPTPPNG